MTLNSHTLGGATDTGCYRDDAVVTCLLRWYGHTGSAAVGRYHNFSMTDRDVSLQKTTEAKCRALRGDGPPILIIKISSWCYYIWWLFHNIS